MDCLFCKIINGEIKADKVYEDDLSVGIRDINPQAPVHVLIIPKKHISTLNEITEENKNLIGHLFLVAKEIARKEGIAERGYRTVINCNRESGQSIFHIHLHLLGGRLMGWPPG
jgi:histidine triad (HIT) family protein